MVGHSAKRLRGGEALAPANPLVLIRKNVCQGVPDITLASALMMHDAADDSAMVCI